VDAGPAAGSGTVAGRRWPERKPAPARARAKRGVGRVVAGPEVPKGEPVARAVAEGGSQQEKTSEFNLRTTSETAEQR